MKNILILNGSPRRNGRTNKLVNSFIKGAEVNNEIIQFHIYDMDIKGCKGCESCRRNGHCIQKDDMDQMYEAFRNADVVVFASPVYFWTITGPLKTVANRLYAILTSKGYGEFRKESLLIMTAGGADYSQAQRWYETFENNLNWTNLGEILGADKIKEAEDIGNYI